MTDAELDSPLHVLRNDENRSICMIALFLLSTGCHLNEILSTKWRDVNIEKASSLSGPAVARANDFDQQGVRLRKKVVLVSELP